MSTVTTFDLGLARWDASASIFFHLPVLTCIAALLPAPDQALRDFSDCTVVHSWARSHMVQESSLHTGEGSVTQFMTRKTI